MLKEMLVYSLVYQKMLSFFSRVIKERLVYKDYIESIVYVGRSGSFKTGSSYVSVRPVVSVQMRLPWWGASVGAMLGRSILTRTIPSSVFRTFAIWSGLRSPPHIKSTPSQIQFWYRLRGIHSDVVISLYIRINFAINRKWTVIYSDFEKV